MAPARGRDRCRFSQPLGRRAGWRGDSTWPWFPPSSTCVSRGCGSPPTRSLPATVPCGASSFSAECRSSRPNAGPGRRLADQAAALAQTSCSASGSTCGRDCCCPCRWKPLRPTARADAIVVIGDRGMCQPREKLAFAWDLGEEWSLLDRLPFVFARLCWAWRPHVEAGQGCGSIGRLGRRARDEGLSLLDEIARQSAPEVGLSEAACLSYLRDNLEFLLGERQRAGLDRFFELARGTGWLRGGELKHMHGWSTSRLIHRFCYVRLSAMRRNQVSYRVSYQAFHRFEQRH